MEMGDPLLKHAMEHFSITVPGDQSLPEQTAGSMKEAPQMTVVRQLSCATGAALHMLAPPKEQVRLTMATLADGAVKWTIIC